MDDAAKELSDLLGLPVEEADAILTKIVEIVNKPTTVRDVRTPTPRVDTRRYYYIRMNQFETVIDSRDCKDDSSKSDVLTQTLNNKTQAWYFAGYRGDDNLETVVEEWTHSQFVDWLRR